MSATAGRLAAALVFAVPCAAALLVPLKEGRSAGAPTAEELGALEARLTAGARLHPAAAEAPPRGSAPYCRECHPPSPHPGTRVADAMTNAHAAWMDCLGCHWAPEGGERPDPTWVVGPGAAAFAAVLPAERSSPEELAALRAEVTKRRPCFVRGPDCGGCHRSGGMASWARGGERGEAAGRLEHLATVFTLGPGEKWYFPQFP